MRFKLPISETETIEIRPDFGDEIEDWKCKCNIEDVWDKVKHIHGFEITTADNAYSNSSFGFQTCGNWYGNGKELRAITNNKITLIWGKKEADWATGSRRLLVAVRFDLDKMTQQELNNTKILYFDPWYKMNGKKKGETEEYAIVNLVKTAMALGYSKEQLIIMNTFGHSSWRHIGMIIDKNNIVTLTKDWWWILPYHVK